MNRLELTEQFHWRHFDIPSNDIEFLNFILVEN